MTCNTIGSENDIWLVDAGAMVEIWKHTSMMKSMQSRDGFVIGTPSLACKLTEYVEWKYKHAWDVIMFENISELNLLSMILHFLFC